jgi:hypothetical protein
MKLTVLKRRTNTQIHYFDVFNPVLEEWIWCDDWQEVEDYAKGTNMKIGDVS